MCNPNARFHHVYRLGWRALLMAALVIVPVIVGGCQDSDSNSDQLGLSSSADVADGIEPLTLATVNANLALTTAQETRMTAALATYNQERNARRAARPEGGDGWLATRALSGGEPPLMGLLKECAGFLERDQMVELVALIKEQRASARAQWEKRADRPGRGMQERGPGPGFRGDMLDRLAVQLDLTDEQIQELQKLHESMREEFQMRRDRAQQNGRGGFPPDDGAPDFHQAMREELATILTAEQLQRLDSLQESRRSERHGLIQGVDQEHMENRVDFLVKVLELDDDQQTKLETILTAALEQHQQVRESIANRTVDRKEARDQMPQLREQTESEIRDLLTDEQIVLFDALQDLLPHGARKGPRPL